MLVFVTGIASAQSPTVIACNVFAQPLTVRAEGLAEQLGDVTTTCTGGTAPAAGTALPQVNISVTTSVNLTNRLLSDPITDALLFIDDPQPLAPGNGLGAQSPCAPAAGSTVCAPLFASATVGAASETSALGTIRNIFQGVRQNDTTVVFLAVPINAPGVGGSRTYRVKNLRGAIAGSTATNGQIFAFVSIQNPPANLQLNSSTANIGFVQPGIAVALRNQAGTGGLSTGSARIFNFVCDTYNRDLYDNSANNYSGSGAGNTFTLTGRSSVIRYTEGYPASFKRRDVNPPLTEPTATVGNQNVPQSNNGLDPAVINNLVVDSGFFNINFTATNGLNRAGRADHGTRLRAVFGNIPANIKVFVSAHALNSALAFSTTSSRSSGGGETGIGNGATNAGAGNAVALQPKAFAVSSTTTGQNIAAATVLANPLSAAEEWSVGSRVLPAGYPSGAQAGLLELPVSGGSASAIWEIFSETPNDTDRLSFAIAWAYRSVANPGAGTATASGSFAPVGGGSTMSAGATIPRFSDSGSTASTVASWNLCVTNLLYPFVTNQVGFDTGMSVSNTTQDPFGTPSQSGNFTVNYYGGTTGGGAAPAAQTTTSVLAGGQTAVFSLSSGGTNGIAATPGFQGYIIVQCQFRFAHGFAFISDLGAAKLSHGYLALVMDLSGTGDSLNRTGIAGENLGQ
ncbi:MAG: hypothetical protein HYZ37_16345 [Candidatus Solibacter usitatus]|nr:hypothetical protein [Candidatus Solibacter usitatus]